MSMKAKACELCNQQASLYCASDSAFLCWNCDAAVHRANFLVARHLRHLLCSKCNRLAGIHFSGRISGPVTSTCRSCSPENRSDHGDYSLPSCSSSSLTSACVSSSESCATAPKKDKVRRTRVAGRKRKMMMMMMSCSSSVTDDASSAAKTAERKRRRNVGSCGAVAEAEEVFVKWSRELGLGANGNCVASLASRALGFCLGRWSALPFTVAAATSFWLGLRFCGDRWGATLQNLRRLEAISGVPAKLILAAHAKLARVFTHRRELQEGSDEC